MAGISFSSQKQAPKEVLESGKFDGGKYADLFEHILKNGVVGEWVKVDVIEDSEEAADKSVYNLMTSIRAWRAKQVKNGKNIDLSLRKRRVSNVHIEVWIQIKHL